MINAIEFKDSLTVSKFIKSEYSYDYWDYKVEINEDTYYIYKHKNNTWSAYDIEENEFFAISDTRKDVVKNIISGLWRLHLNTL